MKRIKVEGFHKEKLRISGRLDWAIFWFFAVMVAYVAGRQYGMQIDEWLFGRADPWISNLNVPSGYGRGIVAVVLLAVLGEAVLFFYRKPVWAKAAVAAAGLIFPLAFMGMYLVHCKLIVSVLWEEEPRIMSVDLDGSQYYLKQWEGIPSAEEYRKALELCRSLEAVTDPEEIAACMDWYREEGEFLGVDMVELYFEEKYGHHYSLDLRVKDGYIYLWRGYLGDAELVTFFQDNGLVEWMDSIRAK